MIKSTDNIQVIGGGCGRTGTLSLKKALEILGYIIYISVIIKL